ncbi:phosphoadenosine phosphosulfate reductase family protein [Streptomyces sp. NPDC090442]|uniref:phosphoadenosine phosphosulfate reductase domain-containing protein n=1 Tax=Streptomyces sp. NPDC090442 TaxID=3365962 RepID=UPI0037FE8BE7
MTRLVAELSSLGRPVRILNCLGPRAAESPPRAKLATVEIDRPASNGKRHVTSWRPIHTWTDAEVWKEIGRSGLPYHQAYDWGMGRLSCSFCVLGCAADTVLAARLRPRKAAEYVATEAQVGADFKHGLSMKAIVERAKALDAEQGKLQRPARGTALARYIGRKATREYLERLDRARFALAA